MRNLRFQVDSRLATLLSQEYSSTERALKELVDNGWDADAGNVSIVLPKPMSDTPIVIEDDGYGMTEEEIRRHYLFIASDRRARRGERTTNKQRRVKGRKGVGKFAGLMAASEMKVETWANSRHCGFTLRIEDLAKVEDIEHLEYCPICVAKEAIAQVEGREEKVKENWEKYGELVSDLLGAQDTVTHYVENGDSLELEKAQKLRRKVVLELDAHVHSMITVNHLVVCKMALDSLEYVERNYPGLSGYGVRQDLIKRLHAIIAELKEGEV